MRALELLLQRREIVARGPAQVDRHARLAETRERRAEAAPRPGPEPAEQGLRGEHEPLGPGRVDLGAQMGEEGRVMRPEVARVVEGVLADVPGQVGEAREAEQQQPVVVEGAARRVRRIERAAGREAITRRARARPAARSSRSSACRYGGWSSRGRPHRRSGPAQRRGSTRAQNGGAPSWGSKTGFASAGSRSGAAAIAAAPGIPFSAAWAASGRRAVRVEGVDLAEGPARRGPGASVQSTARASRLPGFGREVGPQQPAAPSEADQRHPALEVEEAVMRRGGPGHLLGLGPVGGDLRRRAAIWARTSASRRPSAVAQPGGDRRDLQVVIGAVVVARAALARALRAGRRASRDRRRARPRSPARVARARARRRASRSRTASRK